MAGLRSKRQERNDGHDSDRDNDENRIEFARRSAQQTSGVDVIPDGTAALVTLSCIVDKVTSNSDCTYSER